MDALASENRTENWPIGERVYVCSPYGVLRGTILKRSERKPGAFSVDTNRGMLHNVRARFIFDDEYAAKACRGSCRSADHPPSGVGFCPLCGLLE